MQWLRCIAVLACAICFVHLRSEAQVTSYTLQTSTGGAQAYTPLVNGTVVASGTQIDDRFFTNVPIGFSFAFNNSQYSTLTISENGYVTFGGAPPQVPGFLGPMSYFWGEGAIAPLGVDLRGRAESQILTQLTGSAPNRVFIVQWQTMGFNNGGNLADSASFQVRLEEGTNNVSVSYGTFQLAENNGYDCEVGLRGRFDGEFATRIVPAPTDEAPAAWANAQTGNASTDRARVAIVRGASMQLLTGGVPPSGLVWSWTAGTQLVPPTLTTPRSGSTFSVPGIFRWNPVSGVSQYRIIVTPDTTATTVPIFRTVNENAFALFPSDIRFTPGSTYYWSVQSVGANNQTGRFADYVPFTIRAQPTMTTFSPSTLLQGQTVTMAINLQNANLTNPPSVSLVNGSTRVAGTSVQSVSTTQISAVCSVPANAPEGLYNLVVVVGSDTLTRVGGVTVTSTNPAPVQNEFQVRTNGFNFCNCGENMWPESVYSRINYSSSAYPEEFRTFANSKDFPSWDDFVPAYERRTGESAFITRGGQRQPDETALKQWRGTKKDWGGSCYGFAISALMAYSGKYTFSAPAFQLPVTDALRTLINRNQLFQPGGEVGALNTDDRTPNNTVNIIRRSFTLPREEQIVIAIFNIQDGKNNGGHAVVPYKITTQAAPNGDILDKIFVYDMNFPGATDTVITVNRTRNTWEYYGLLNTDLATSNPIPWKGDTATQSFYAWGTVNTAFTQRTAQGVLVARSDKSATTTSDEADGEEDNAIETYFEATDEEEEVKKTAKTTATTDNTPSVSLSNVYGSTISNTGATLIRPQIAKATPIAPIATGANVTVEGFRVPIQSKSVQTLVYTPKSTKLVNTVESAAKRTVMSTQWKTLVLNQPQRFILDFDKDLFRTVAGANSSISNISLYKSDPTDSVWQNTIQLRDLTLATNDSLDVQMLNDGASFVVTNYGAARTYALYMERYDTTLFRRVSIPAKSAQTLVIEDWDQIGSCDVMVKMDRGLRNKIDTSYFLRKNGTVTSVKEGQSLVDGSIMRCEVYPNPASDEVRILYSLPIAEAVTIEISDMLGRRMMTIAQPTQSLGRHMVSANVSGLASGAYMVRVQAGTILATQLIQIMR
ncbi:MAG: T9SS type A sorting domain-containing protein [Ignavibacteria bacterium]|nr:T9SS type A sorting domain-containing protein [Ignavibacteria bacterium]